VTFNDARNSKHVFDALPGLSLEDYHVNGFGVLVAKYFLTGFRGLLDQERHALTSLVRLQLIDILAESVGPCPLPYDTPEEVLRDFLGDGKDFEVYVRLSAQCEVAVSASTTCAFAPDLLRAARRLTKQGSLDAM